MYFLFKVILNILYYGYIINNLSIIYMTVVIEDCSNTKDSVWTCSELAAYLNRILSQTYRKLHI